jgi:hypothetical protein
VPAPSTLVIIYLVVRLAIDASAEFSPFHKVAKAAEA